MDCRVLSERCVKGWATHEASRALLPGKDWQEGCGEESVRELCEAGMLQIPTGLLLSPVPLPTSISGNASSCASFQFSPCLISFNSRSETLMPLLKLLPELTIMF